MARSLKPITPEQPTIPITGENQSLPKRLEILLVEDGVINQKVALGLLSEHNVHVANNGLEAIQAMERRSRFDIVLMDVQMPVMDGLEATASIRQREAKAGRHTPIIAMTASAMKGDRERCLDVGMDSYISKPISAEQLRRLIDQYTPGRNHEPVRDPAAQPAAPSEDAALEPRHPMGEHASELKKQATNSLVDWKTALETVQGDQELLLHLIDAVAEECPQLMEQLEQAIRDLDFSVIQRAAHTIKGSIRIFGATTIETVTEELERKAQIESSDSLTTKFEELQHLMNQTLHELNSYPDASRPLSDDAPR